MIGRRLLFLVTLCLIASETTAFDWDPSSPENNAHFMVCSGDDVTVPWSYNTGGAENTQDIQWFVEGDIVATYAANHFFTSDDDLEFASPAGLTHDKVKVNDSGVYSVIVNIRNTSGYCAPHNTSVTVSVIVAPALANATLTVRRRPGVVHDADGQAFVQLVCGHFVGFGQPAVSVHWTTPSGERLSSSGFENGTFFLDLPTPADTGLYSCSLDDVTSVSSCLDDQVDRNVTVHVTHDADELTLMVERAQQVNTGLQDQIDMQQDYIEELEERLANIVDVLQKCEVHDCSELQPFANHSGQASLHLPGDKHVSVFCDQTTDGGGWMVFYRRMGNTVNFHRDSSEYAAGFGDATDDFFLGFENLHQVTTENEYYLRVSNGTYSADYSDFSISNSSDGYRMEYTFKEGVGGDLLNDVVDVGQSLADRDASAYSTLSSKLTEMKMKLG